MLDVTRRNNRISNYKQHVSSSHHGEPKFVFAVQTHRICSTNHIMSLKGIKTNIQVINTLSYIYAGDLGEDLAFSNLSGRTSLVGFRFRVGVAFFGFSS